MTDELLRDKIKQLRADGRSLQSIAEALSVTVEQVRYALDVNVYTDGETTPAEIREIELRTGKRYSEMDAAVLAQSGLNARTSRRGVGEFRQGGSGGPGYKTAPGGGKLKDGNPAPASRLDPNYVNRHKNKRRLRGI